MASPDANLPLLWNGLPSLSDKVACGYCLSVSERKKKPSILSVCQHKREVIERIASITSASIMTLVSSTVAWLGALFDYFGLHYQPSLRSSV